MKKYLISALFAVFASAAFAFSWSGIIDNNTTVTTPDFENITLNQSNGIYLSVKCPVNENVRFVAEGLYKYKLSSVDGNNKLSNIADVDLFKVNGVWKSGTANIVFDAGRFTISDLTGSIFNQCSDGINIKYETAKWNTGLYAGYTGLLNGLNVSMVDGVVEANDFYSLCNAYVPLSVNFNYSLGSTVIGAQGYFFKGITSGLTDKIYGIASLKGSITNAAAYSCAVAVGVNDYEDMMLYGKVDCTAYIGNKGLITGGVEYASGAQGDLVNFTSITYKPAASIGVPASGVIIPSLTGIYVNKAFIATLNEKIVIAMPQDEMEFTGVDSTLSVIYNVLSDVQIGCDVMAFTGKESDYNNFSFTAKATLAF